MSNQAFKGETRPLKVMTKAIWKDSCLDWSLTMFIEEYPNKKISRVFCLYQRAPKKFYSLLENTVVKAVVWKDIATQKSTGCRFPGSLNPACERPFLTTEKETNCLWDGKFSISTLSSCSQNIQVDRGGGVLHLVVEVWHWFLRSLLWRGWENGQYPLISLWN